MYVQISAASRYLSTARAILTLCPHIPQVLLPLFAQFDLPIMSDDDDTVDVKRIDPALCINFIDLLGKLLLQRYGLSVPTYIHTYPSANIHSYLRTYIHTQFCGMQQ